MRRTVAIISLALAWVFANGAVLDAVQVFAWGRMVRDFQRAGLTLERAVTKALDGSAPCEICSAVDHARQQQPPETVERSSEKLVLACPPADAPALTAPAPDWPPLLAASAPSRSEAVPVPPPRV